MAPFYSLCGRPAKCGLTCLTRTCWDLPLAISWSHHAAFDVAQSCPCATRTPPFLRPTNASRASKLSRLRFIATGSDPPITDPTGLCDFILPESAVAPIWTGQAATNCRCDRVTALKTWLFRRAEPQIVNDASRPMGAVRGGPRPAACPE